MKKIKGKGGGGGEPRTPPIHTPREAPNTLRSKSTAKIVDLISEGKISGLVDGAKSVFFDGVALQAADDSFTFEGVELIERLGLPDQDPVPGFGESQSEVNVGLAVTTKAPVTVTITDPDINSIRVKVSVPALYQTTQLGDLIGASVQFKIELRGTGENYVTISTPTIEGKTVGVYEQSHEVPLAGDAPWDVRVSRLSPDTEENPVIQNNLNFTSYTEVIEADLIYPDTAIIALKLDSQLFGGKIPKRAYEIKGIEIQVPSNYDPETRIYTGMWDGTFQMAYSNNPAWVFYDIITNVRYGLGDFVAPEQMDKFQLFQIGQYCDIFIDDGFGGTEPRFTLNAVIQSRTEAYALINSIASVFRGMAFWAAGAVTAAQDAPADPARIVTPANVIEGAFSYAGSALSARHTAVLVTWNDPQDSYKPAIEVVEDPELIFLHGWSPVDVNAFGCTSRGQANRVGRWLLDSEKNETETVTYTASFDHADAVPGQIIAISDPSRVGARLGGRLIDVSGVNVQLDADYTVVVGDKILVQLDDDSVEEKDILSNISSDTIEIDSPFSTPPVQQAMFIVQPTAVAPTLWRIISNVEVDKNNYEITALRHDSTKYDRIEAGVNIEPLPTSLLPVGEIVAPANLTILENLYKSNNTVKTRLNISFTPSIDPRALLYRVEVRPPDGNWTTIQTTPSSVAEVLDAQAGLWDIAVTALTSSNDNGADSARIELLAQTVVGKTAPPADVQNFIADRRVDGIFLRWDEVQDLDLVGYDIRRGADFDTGEVIADLFVGTSIFVPLATSTQETFLIRARDELNILSLNVTSVISALLPPDPVSGFQALPQDANINFSWDQTPGDRIEYEVREGLTWESGRPVFRTGATQKTVLFPRKNLEQVTFHIKSISRAGLFSIDAAFFITGQAPEFNRNEILELDLQAAGWIGIQNNLEEVSNNLLLTEVSPGIHSLFGEYAEIIDLGIVWRARNWLETRMVLFADSPLTWDEAIFSWDDPQAETSWLPTADTDNAALEAWLAPEELVPDPDLQEGWSLDGTLIGAIAATAPAVSENVNYDFARYHDGLKVGAMTRVKWSFAFPSNFTISVTIKFDELFANDGLIMFLSSGSLDMALFYVNATGEILLLDENGDSLSVLPRITVDQFAILAISQDSTTRRLLWYEVETDTVLSDEAEFTPIGSIDTIALYED